MSLPDLAIAVTPVYTQPHSSLSPSLRSSNPAAIAASRALTADVAATSSFSKKMGSWSSMMRLFERIDPKWWHFFGDDEDEEDTDKTERGALKASQHMAFGSGVCLSTFLSLVFYNHPDVAVGMTSSVTDLVKTWSTYLGKTPDLERSVYASALLFLMLSIAKETIDVSNSPFLELFLSLPSFFFFMGIARAALRRIDLISTLSLCCDSGIPLLRGRVTLPASCTKLALPLVGGIGLYSLMGVSRNPLVNASLGVLSKSQFRKVMDILGKTLSKTSSPIPQIAGISLLAAIVLPSLNLYFEWDRGGFAEGISGMCLLVGSDTLVRIVKTAINTLQPSKKETKETIEGIKIKKDKKAKGDAILSTEEDKPKKDKKTKTSLATRCVAAVTAGAAACATFAVSLVDTGPSGTALLASFCQEIAGLVKIATKEGILSRISMGVSALLIAGSVLTNGVTLFKKEIGSEFPPSAHLALSMITAIAASILFYQMKRAVRPAKVKC